MPRPPPHKAISELMDAPSILKSKKGEVRIYSAGNLAAAASRTHDQSRAKVTESARYTITPQALYIFSGMAPRVPAVRNNSISSSRDETPRLLLQRHHLGRDKLPHALLAFPLTPIHILPYTPNDWDELTV